LFYAFETIFLDMAMQKWRNLHHLSWRDDYCKETYMWSSFSCSLPPIMARAAAYLPYLQSTGCPIRKWNNCCWGTAKTTVRCSSTR